MLDQRSSPPESGQLYEFEQFLSYRITLKKSYRPVDAPVQVLVPVWTEYVPT